MNIIFIYLGKQSDNSEKFCKFWWYNTSFPKLEVETKLWPGWGDLLRSVPSVILCYTLLYSGISWYCMVLHGGAYYYMVLLGIAWYCMVLHGIAWYYMVWNGIAPLEGFFIYIYIFFYTYMSNIHSGGFCCSIKISGQTLLNTDFHSKFCDFQNLSVFSNFSAWNHIVCHRYR